MQRAAVDLSARLQECARLQQVGRAGEALRELKRLLKRQPGHPAVLHMLGLAEYNLGDLANAEKRLRAALKKVPGHPAVASNLGLVLRRRGQPERAIAAFRSALKTAPDFVDAHYNLAMTLIGLGRADEAVAHLEGVPALLRAHPRLQGALADAKRALGEFEAAFGLYTQALKAAPDDARLLQGLAALPTTMVPGDKALALVERAARSAPYDAGVQAELAARLEQANRLDDAERTARKARDLAPHRIRPHLTLATLALRRKDATAAKSLLETAQTLPMAAEDAVDFHHCKARLHVLRGEPGLAVAEQKKAQDALRRTQAGQCVDPGAMPARVRAFTAWAEARQKSGIAAPNDGRAGASNSDAPVFFVGFPRSGTTLMERVLDAHPGVIASPEVPLLGQLEAALPNLIGRKFDVPGGLQDLTDHERSVAAAWYAEAFAQAVEPPDGRRMIDKMPFNLVDLALVEAVFPDAKVLVALRDPRDTVLSCFMHVFEAHPGTINFRTPEETARLYAQVMDLWDHYRNVLSLPHLSYRYEDLIDDFEGTVRRVLTFLDLPWDPAVLDYAERAKSRYVATPSASEVIRAPHREGIGRWRAFAEELAPVWESLAPYAARFGYSPA